MAERASHGRRCATRTATAAPYRGRKSVPPTEALRATSARSEERPRACLRGRALRGRRLSVEGPGLACAGGRCEGGGCQLKAQGLPARVGVARAAVVS